MTTAASPVTGTAAGVVAGIGCRQACPAEAIVTLVHQAERAAGHRVRRLAVPAFRDRNAGVMAAAETLGVGVTWVDMAALLAAQPRCVTYSAAARRAVGVGAVAEGCALAAAGPGGLLLLPRIGAGMATCALAVVP